MCMNKKIIIQTREGEGEGEGGRETQKMKRIYEKRAGMEGLFGN